LLLFFKKEVLFFTFLLLLPKLALAAGVFTSPRDTVRLVVGAPAPVNGTILLGLQFHLAPGWHIYWSNPGDAGLAPVVTAQGPVVFGPLQFPPPSLLVQGPITDYVLSGDVILPFTAAQVGQNVTARAQWLVCADVCVPEHAVFTLTFPAAPTKFPANAIIPSPFAASQTPDGTLSVAGPGPAQVATAHFFPATPGMLVNSAPQNLGFTATGLTLGLKLLPGGPPLSGVLELTDSSGAMQALSLTPSLGGEPTHAPYLLLAFLGGLILNLMPCVFPVLALKALAITRLGGRGVRREAFGYTAGVLAAMLLLGGLLLLLRALGESAGWGFQFQHPGFIALMAWLMFALTLNLAGWFDFALPPALGRLHTQHSVATGFLAVLLATPCTAPFMGAALAAALSAPPWAAIGIFLALGLGLAAPVLVLALIPGLARLLPRPGAWMLVLQRVLALPMFATFLWLAWVLQRQTGAYGLLLLLAGAALLALTLRRARILAVCVLLLLPFLHASASAPLTLPGAAPYSAARLATLRAAGRPVFLDLTAAWCVTCLVNEATTLKNPSVQADFKARHIAVLVGDWTHKDLQISALLAAHHRAGVPLYLYYPPGRPVVMLPQILDPALLRRVISPGG